MKKIVFLILFAIVLTLFSACGHNEQQKFEELHQAFVARGNGVTGYEVDEITEFDSFQYFCVRICLNTDDATSVDDYVWFELYAQLFATEEEAQDAYAYNQETGVGGECLTSGRAVIYWLKNDEFADLYKEVFYSVYPEETQK